MLKRINPEISLGFVIASLFWIAVLGWQSSYSLPENEKQRCYEEAGHKDEECKTFWERTTSDPIAFFTFTLSMVTLALGAISVRQFHYLRRSDETARIAANAAADAARASTRQADIAEQSLSKIERPYIFIFNIGALEIVEDQEGDFLRVTYSVANYGQTPAVIENGRVSLTPSTEPLIPAIMDFNHPLVVSPILAPGEIRVCEETCRWSGDISYDESGNRFPTLNDESLWFWTTIAYRGSFTFGHETSALLRFDERTGRFFIGFATQELNYEK